jgi:hypothetical protein
MEAASRKSGTKRINRIFRPRLLTIVNILLTLVYEIMKLNRRIASSSRFSRRRQLHRTRFEPIGWEYVNLIYVPPFVEVLSKFYFHHQGGP